MKTQSVHMLAVAAVLLSATVGCKTESTSSGGPSSTGSTDKPKIAYVTNGVASFWVIAKAGVDKGGEEFGADVETLMPSEGIGMQKNMIEDLLTKGADGIAVSPIDPENQIELLNKAAQRTKLITHDSDAPGSDRLCYIGMDNYLAGRMCGQLVVEAMPEGGKLAIFIGRLEQDNARRRRQGVIDEILGRSEDPSRFDPPDAELQEGKWHIVGTYTDQFDRAQGKANAEDALSRHPDLAGMVGLFAYNPPLMLEALKQADKLNKVKVIAFDEANETLQGIVDGTVHGTVVQNPFEYGRQSVRVLTGLAQGKSLSDLEIPEDGFLNIPARKIRSDNVEEFWAELKRNLGESDEPAEPASVDAPSEEEAPAPETPAEEEAPAPETPAEEEAPAPETPAEEEAPAPETPAEEEAPAPETPAEEEAPAPEAPAEEEAPAPEAPAEEEAE